MPSEASRSWTSVTVAGNETTLELISGALDEDLVAGIALVKGSLRIFLQPKQNARELLTHLQRFLDNLVHEGLIEAQTLALSDVEEVDWVARWRMKLGPVRAGKRFVIVPPGINTNEKEGDIVLRLEPRMAFGTGEHPTTRMSLELLEPVVPRGGVVLDLGCGNGILSIAALLLGAREAVAVDFEQEAVTETRENAVFHAVADRLCVVRADALTFAMPLQADLLTANIFLTPILRGLDPWLTMLSPKGWLVLSGVRFEEEGAILLNECALRGLEVDKTLNEDGWMAVRLRRSGA